MKHWTVNYTGTQGFLITVSHSLAQSLWELKSSFDWLFQTSSAQTFYRMGYFSYPFWDANLFSIVLSLKIHAFLHFPFAVMTDRCEISSLIRRITTQNSDVYLAVLVKL